MSASSLVMNTSVVGGMNNNESIEHIFEAEPSVTRIGFTELNKRIKTAVKLVNKSTKSHRLHIIPPRSQHWKVSYVKKVRNKTNAH